MPANLAVTGPRTPDCVAFRGGRVQREEPVASTSHTGTVMDRWTGECGRAGGRVGVGASVSVLSALSAVTQIVDPPVRWRSRAHIVCF